MYSTVHTDTINPPIQSPLCPVLASCYHRAAAYRILSWPSTSARLLFCPAPPPPRLHARLGRWATMQRGDRGGRSRGEGRLSCLVGATHGLTSESGMQHTLSAENCCSVSPGIGAAPAARLISSQQPPAPQLATARRPSVSWLLWSPVLPGRRSTPNLTPAAYHVAACWGLRTLHTAHTALSLPSHVAHAVLQGLAATTREGRIGSGQCVPGPQGPWSTNAEEMTLWICSAAWNEGKMAEQVPRTMQGCHEEDTHHTPCRARPSQGSCTTVYLPDHDRIFFFCRSGPGRASDVLAFWVESRKGDEQLGWLTACPPSGLYSDCAKQLVLDVQRRAVPVVLPNRETG